MRLIVTEREGSPVLVSCKPSGRLEELCKLHSLFLRFLPRKSPKFRELICIISN